MWFRDRNVELSDKSKGLLKKNQEELNPNKKANWEFDQQHIGVVSNIKWVTPLHKRHSIWWSTGRYPKDPWFGIQAEEQATEKQKLNSAEVDQPQRARTASQPLLNDTDQQSGWCGTIIFADLPCSIFTSVERTVLYCMVGAPVSCDILRNTEPSCGGRYRELLFLSTSGVIVGNLSRGYLTLLVWCLEFLPRIFMSSTFLAMAEQLVPTCWEDDHWVTCLEMDASGNGYPQFSSIFNRIFHKKV